MNQKRLFLSLLLAGLTPLAHSEKAEDGPQEKTTLPLTPFVWPKKAKLTKSRHLRPIMHPPSEVSAKPACSTHPGYEIASQGAMYNYTLRGTAESEVWHYDYVAPGKQLFFNFSSPKGHYVQSFEEYQPSVYYEGKWVVGGAPRPSDVKKKRWRSVSEFDNDDICDEKGERNRGRPTHVVSYELAE